MLIDVQKPENAAPKSVKENAFIHSDQCVRRISGAVSPVSTIGMAPIGEPKK